MALKVLTMKKNTNAEEGAGDAESTDDEDSTVDEEGTGGAESIDDEESTVDEEATGGEG